MTDQLDLFTPVRPLNDGLYAGTPGHAVDECSELAAAKIKPKVTALQRQVFWIIKNSRGLTVFEVMRATGRCKDTIAPRITELKILEMIEKSGRKRRSPNNGWCNVWIAVDGFQYERA